MNYLRKNFNKIAIEHDMLPGTYFKKRNIYIRKEDLINFICDLEDARYKFISSGLIAMNENYDMIHRFMHFLAFDIIEEIIYSRELRKNISLYVKDGIDGEFTLFAIDEIV